MGNDRFKVLWFDDNPKVSFIDNAYISGIDITVAENLEKGLSLINSAHVFDAFIFDANYKKKDVDESSLVLSDLINEVAKITNDKTPWFVLTAGDFSGIEAISYIIPESIWEKELDTKRFYNKVSEDEETLFNDIKRTVKYQNTIEWNIKNKYISIFELCTDKYIGESNFDKVMRLLIAVEKNDNNNPTYFNEIRKIMESVFLCCNDKGLFPYDCVEMNARSTFLGKKEMQIFVPVYIQRNIHSVVQISQEGSHRLTIDNDITEGKCPYLFKSTTLELLNVLLWFKEFSDLYPNGIVIEEITSEGCLNGNDLGPEKITGIIQKDDKGNYYCNEYILNYNYTHSNFEIGDNIQIVDFQDNSNDKTSSQYPKFATKYKKYNKQNNDYRRIKKQD